MLKLYKNKGVSLIELMVAVGLGLTLILSMLAFYSISLQNVAEHQTNNHEQQQLRRMLNLLETDIENTGGFECAKPADIFNSSEANFVRLPTGIISLGSNRSRQQMMFVHPITAEHRYNAMGMIDVKPSITSHKGVQNFAPHLVNAGCGQDAQSPLYIGTTLLEVIPISNITTDLAAAANNVEAFVALSSIQSRRNAGDTTTPVVYAPSVNDATVLFFSNNGAGNLPFGQSSVTISFGFSPEGRFAHVPAGGMTLLKDGGWINPFSSDANYNLLVDKSATITPHPTLINKTLHDDAAAQSMSTYPLSTAAMKQIRAIKFTFNLNQGTDRALTITRVIRFKNTHLMKINDTPSS